MTTATRYIAIHAEHGIFIGTCMGFAFWSKIDPVGQEAAATFESVEEAAEFIRGWDDGIGHEILKSLKFVEVQPDMGEHASISACVRAGAEGWLPYGEDTETANSLPI